ncbi:MAG: ferritin-like domain-containing protein [Solirubrobacterales bacterium]|nr:ferritin-like domain-containing protein [Solirubrobacterales bacterium]
MAGPITRRALLGRPGSRQPGGGDPPGDAELLHALLAIELLAVAAYQRVAAAPSLSPGNRTVVLQLHGQEQQHAAALRQQLGSAATQSGPATAAATNAALAKRNVAERIGRLQHEPDAIRLLIAVEGVAEGGYHDAISKLSDPRLLRLSAEIMANEAQHDTILRELLHPGDAQRAVPVAFVEGTQGLMLAGSLGGDADRP